MANEQMRPKVARFRARWRAHQHRLDPKHLIFIDETWIKTNMTRTCGWAIKGKRLTAHVPHGHWKPLTFLAGLRHDRQDGAPSAGKARINTPPLSGLAATSC
jgi:hypothetical protein